MMVLLACAVGAFAFFWVGFQAGTTKGWVDCERHYWPAIQRGLKAKLLGERAEDKN